jgi:hypothetical protein
MYFAYLFFNYWKFEKLKLKLSNLIFKINKYLPKNADCQA